MGSKYRKYLVYFYTPRALINVIGGDMIKRLEITNNSRIDDTHKGIRKVYNIEKLYLGGKFG